MVLKINRQYYANHAQEFYDSTVEVDMQTLYRQFLPHIPDGASILDAGCGSGRDSKAFIDQGFDVEAFDASEELAALASQLMGKKVSVDRFQTYQSEKAFDGIWACASLLHVPLIELPEVFQHLTAMLKNGGVFYCSFKYGQEEIARNGRLFTNLNEDCLAQQIKGLPLLIEKQWLSGDLRAGRESEKWLNVIMRKGT